MLRRRRRSRSRRRVSGAPDTCTQLRPGILIILYVISHALITVRHTSSEDPWSGQCADPKHVGDISKSLLAMFQFQTSRLTERPCDELVCMHGRYDPALSLDRFL